MSAHREHPFIAQLEAQQPAREPPRGRAAVLLVIVAFVIGLVATLPLTLGVKTEHAPAVEPGISTPPAPTATEIKTQRLAIDRLRDWRAGYEEAVANGCRLQPLLSAPVGSKP